VLRREAGSIPVGGDDAAVAAAMAAAAAREEERGLALRLLRALHAHAVLRWGHFIHTPLQTSFIELSDVL
jgi:hypothetical protein